MKEYKLAKSYTILAYIAIPIMIFVFGYLLLEPLFTGIENQKSPNAYYFLAPISAIAIVLLFLALKDAINGKFVIDRDRIYTVGIFSNRELLFRDIKGYKTDDKYISIEPNIDGKKRIKISTYFSNTDEIIEWLNERYPDLDVLNIQEEQQEILQNEAFGETAEQREGKLVQAGKITRMLNWPGAIAGAWIIFWPNPYQYALLTCIAIPLLSLIALKFYSGLISVDEKKGRAYPSLFWALFLPSMGLLLRALLDYNIFDYSNVWAPCVLAALALLAFAFYGNSLFSISQRKNYTNIIGLIGILFAYAYGSLITINCYYDASVPEIFNATILGKRISSGKSTTYYFELEAWGNRKEAEEVSVSKKLYHALDQNDHVNIYLKKGKLAIPWFRVSE